MVPENNKWLVRTLLDKEVVTREQLTQVLARQKETRENLEKILVDLRLVKDEELTALKKKESFYDETSLLGQVDPEVLKLVPETVARRYVIIPLSKNGKNKNGKKILTLAVTDLNDVVAIDTVRTISGCEIKAVLASEKDIMTAVERYYSGSPDRDSFTRSGQGKWTYCSTGNRGRPHPG